MAKDKEITIKDVIVNENGTTDYVLGRSDGITEPSDLVTTAIEKLIADPGFIEEENYYKKLKAFDDIFSEHYTDFANIVDKAEEWTEEILPFIILVLAERSGEPAAHALTYEEVCDLIKSGEKPDKDKTPFERVLAQALDEFSFAGEPETDYAKGLLSAASNLAKNTDISTQFTEAVDDIRKHIRKGKQNEGRDLRRQMKANAEKQGAVMKIRGGLFPIFSNRDLWDAFSPSRIARLGELGGEKIDEETGRVNDLAVQDNDIIQLNALDISYKALMLLTAIIANSVENYREYFVSDKPIKFYVKGALNTLDVDPRIREDQQLNLDRKTAGVLYLEKELIKPLLTLVGKIPDGSRYAVLNYIGYDVNSDTMEIRTPYLYQLWKITQTPFFERQNAIKARKNEGKKPLKKDLRPLEVNMLFKNTAYKEDNTVLEIATYITNILLNAGYGSTTKKTEISYRTLINNCPRLKEKLEEIERRPRSKETEGGKKTINTSALYNTELKKIARAFCLITDSEKCDALLYYDFLDISTGKKKGGKWVVKPPTKSILDDKIIIKYNTIKNMP